MTLPIDVFDYYNIYKDWKSSLLNCLIRVFAPPAINVVYSCWSCYIKNSEEIKTEDTVFDTENEPAGYFNKIRQTEDTVFDTENEPAGYFNKIRQVCKKVWSNFKNLFAKLFKQNILRIFHLPR
eukprot:GHVP01030716.1.p1 GENE.GHVP01030716.1~~GHVP01030716.1.p1  ORF type:complete len:124 (-),score=12.93 GHVP01030716.1:109-480(-)